MKTMLRALTLLVVAPLLAACFQTRSVSLGAHQPVQDSSVDTDTLDASDEDTRDGDEREDDDSEVEGEFDREMR